MWLTRLAARTASLRAAKALAAFRPAAAGAALRHTDPRPFRPPAAGDLEGPLRGIIPRSIEDIFCQIQNDPEPSSRCSAGSTQGGARRAAC